MPTYDRVIKIKDYIQNSDEARTLIQSFEKSLYLEKSSTGQGATSAIGTITDKNVMLLTSNIGPIKNKEQQSISTNQVFVYGGSTDKWTEIEKRLAAGEQLIMTTTFDQVPILQRNHKKLYQFLINHVNWFIDEWHVFGDADYRKKTLAPAIDCIFKDLKMPFILSTATPTFGHYDIPPDWRLKLEYVRIEYETPVLRPVTILPYNAWYSQTKLHLSQGNRVGLFTNSIKNYSVALNPENFGLQTHILVGPSLQVKTSKIKEKTLQDQVLLNSGTMDLDMRVHMFSSTYSIGFDITVPIALGVCADGTNEAECKVGKEIVQCLGRSRVETIDGTIYYNGDYVFKGTLLEAINALNTLEYDGYGDYMIKAQPWLKELEAHRTYPKENLIKYLEEKDFVVTDNTETFDKVKAERIDIRTAIETLMRQAPEITRDQFTYVYNNINGDDPEIHGLDESYLIIYAYAVTLLATDSPYLWLIPTQYDRIVRKLKVFFDVNNDLIDDLDCMTRIQKQDSSKKQKEMAIAAGAKIDPALYQALHSWCEGDGSMLAAKEVVNSLFVILATDDGSIITEEAKNMMDAFTTISNILCSDYMVSLSRDCGIDVKKAFYSKNKVLLSTINTKGYNTKAYFTNSANKIKKALEKIPLTEEQIGQVNGKIEGHKKSLRENKSENVYKTIKDNKTDDKKQKELHAYMVLYFLSASLAGHTIGFKKTIKDNREYNITTKTTRQLRPITPYYMDTFDMKSAFPSFVDIILGTDLRYDAYPNLMKEYGCDKEAAKVKFNRALNDHWASKNDTRIFFLKAGYPKDKVEILLEIIFKGKGNFFKTMTPLEEEAIKEFVKVNNITNYTRIHDAVTFFYQPNKEYIINFGKILFERSTKSGIEETPPTEAQKIIKAIKNQIMNPKPILTLDLVKETIYKEATTQNIKVDEDRLNERIEASFAAGKFTFDNLIPKYIINLLRRFEIAQDPLPQPTQDCALNGCKIIHKFKEPDGKLDEVVSEHEARYAAKPVAQQIKDGHLKALQIIYGNNLQA